MDAAPTADLGARQADLLAGQEMFETELQQPLTQIGTYQTGLSADAQSFLAGADEQWVSAAQNVVSADQAFVAADQAGDLSGIGLLPVDWTVIDADLGLLSADVNVGADTILALIDPDIGTMLPL